MGNTGSQLDKVDTQTSPPTQMLFAARNYEMDSRYRLSHELAHDELNTSADFRMAGRKSWQQGIFIFYKPTHDKYDLQIALLRSEIASLFNISLG